MTRRIPTLALALGLVLALGLLGGCEPITGGVQVAAPPGGGAAGAGGTILPDVVPPGLTARAWVIRRGTGELVAGALGVPGRLRLDPAERPLAAGPDAVATVVTQGSGATARSAVTIRSLGPGAFVRTITVPGEALVAVFAERRLIVGGHLPGSMARDPGLVAISLDDGTVTELLPGGDASGLDGELVRTVGISPSGRTLVSGLCGQTGCALDVVELGTGAVRRILDRIDGFPGAVTDEVVVVGDDESGWIAGVDLETGERRWTRTDGEFQHAYATADGRVIQAIARASAGTFVLEALDPATGVGRELLRRGLEEGLTLWPELSNERVAVLGRGVPLADAGVAGDRIVSAATVELATGEMAPSGLALDLGG